VTSRAHLSKPFSLSRGRIRPLPADSRCPGRLCGLPPLASITEAAGDVFSRTTVKSHSIITVRPASSVSELEQIGALRAEAYYEVS
jgi:hypothetical protein